jgi:hypothetical protein
MKKKASQVSCVECIPSRYFLFQIFSVGILSSGLFWPKAFIIKHTLFHDTSGGIRGVLCVHFPLRFISLFLVYLGGSLVFSSSIVSDGFFCFSFRENPWLPHTHTPLITPLKKKLVYSFAFLNECFWIRKTNRCQTSSLFHSYR